MRIGKLAMVALVFVLLLGACEMPLGTPTPALGATPVVEQRVPTAPPSGAPQMGPSPTQSSPTNPAPAMAEPTRPVAQATATNAPPPAAQGVVDEQGRLLFSRASDLSKLNSYRVHHTWNYRWAKGINSGVTEILVEFVREPYAERVVIIRDKKESSRQELIRVNGVTYMLTPDGWQTMKAETPLFPPEADPRIGMLPYLAEATGNLVGEEQLDGQQTRHYHYDQEGLHFSGYYTQTAQASADVWVSTEHEVYIKATLHWEGEAQDLGKGSFDLESRVTDINQPITITAPEGVTPPELPDDVVLMGDARELALVDKLIYYQTNRSPFEVADYYKFKMPAYGWALEFDSREQGGATDESKPVTMRFSKTGKILNMSAQSGPPTLVILAVVPTE